MIDFLKIVKGEIDYFDETGTIKFPKRKGTWTTVWIFFKDKTYIYVSCYNYDPSDGGIDQLRFGISDSYFKKYAFKKFKKKSLLCKKN